MLTKPIILEEYKKKSDLKINLNGTEKLIPKYNLKKECLKTGIRIFYESLDHKIHGNF